MEWVFEGYLLSNIHKMDIDEFLDKELQTKKESAEQESSSGTDKVEKIEEKAIEEIKEEGPIKHYFELWKKISDCFISKLESYFVLPSIMTFFASLTLFLCNK